MTPKEFSQALASGKYQTAGGARKAVGKFHDATEDDRNAMRKLVDKHFGGESAPVAAAPKKERAKRVVAAKEPKEAKSEAPAEKAPRKPRVSKARVSVVSDVQADVERNLGLTARMLEQSKALRELGQEVVDLTTGVSRVISQEIARLQKQSGDFRPLPSLPPPQANGTLSIG